MAAAQTSSVPPIAGRALVARGEKVPFELVETLFDPATLRDDEACVRFTHAGICHTDLSVWAGHIPNAGWPAVLGHEGAGVVEALPQGYRGELSVGDSVLASFSSCGSCRTCRHSQPAACELFIPRNFGCLCSDMTTQPRITGKSIDATAGFFGQSSFAQVSPVHLSCLVRVPRETPGDLACSFGCGIQTGFGTVVNHAIPLWRAGWHQADASKDAHADAHAATPKSLAVFGIGAVGLGAVVSARRAGIPNVVAVDPVESRRELARQAGATAVVDPKQVAAAGGDVAAEVRKIAGGDGAGGDGSCDVVVEASGAAGVFETAVLSSAHKGHVVVIGAVPAGTKLSFDAFHVLSHNLTISSIVEGASRPSAMVPRLVEMLARGDLDVMRAACRTYPPERMAEAVDDALSGRVLKPVISWDKK